MRRIIYPLLAAAALLGIAVTPALARQHDHRARDGRGHERRHHERRHHERVHHASRIRHRTFGTAENSAAGGTPTAGGSDPSDEATAGTVSSFTNGVLTITLRSGSMVSGTVTPGTEIECRGASIGQGDRSAGGENSRGDENSVGDGDQNENAESAGDHNENDHNGEDRSDDHGDEMQSCGSAALQPGTVVREAELALRDSAAHWDKVELLRAGSGNSGATDNEDS